MWESPYFTGILRTPVRLSARWTPVRWVDLKNSMFMFMYVFLFWCRKLSYSMTFLRETSTCSNPSRLCCPGSKPIHKACCNKKGHFYVFNGNFKFWIEFFKFHFLKNVTLTKNVGQSILVLHEPSSRVFFAKYYSEEKLKTFLAGVPPKVFGQLHSLQCTLKTQKLFATCWSFV